MTIATHTPSLYRGSSHQSLDPRSTLVYAYYVRRPVEEREAGFEAGEDTELVGDRTGELEAIARSVAALRVSANRVELDPFPLPERASSTNCLPSSGIGRPCSTPVKRIRWPTLVTRGAMRSLIPACTRNISVAVATGTVSSTWLR